MKITLAVAALFCVVAINAHPKDEQIDNCLSSNSVDKKTFMEFMKGKKDDCSGLEPALKCIAEAKGFVKNGVVDLSELEKMAKDEDGKKKISECQSIPASDVCGLAKCVRSAMPCRRKDGDDRNALRDFLTGPKEDCSGLDEYLKCTLETEGIVTNGVVDLSRLENMQEMITSRKS
ncbi:hypothetical protein FQR65_LT01827 [Abscondita terminalis]|nr:hypothetical protein FQR65_LT01827 [Abscondita terminalis]